MKPFSELCEPFLKRLKTDYRSCFDFSASFFWGFFHVRFLVSGRSKHGDPSIFENIFNIIILINYKSQAYSEMFLEYSECGFHVFISPFSWVIADVDFVIADVGFIIN